MSRWTRVAEKEKARQFATSERGKGSGIIILGADHLKDVEYLRDQGTSKDSDSIISVERDAEVYARQLAKKASMGSDAKNVTLLNSGFDSVDFEKHLGRRKVGLLVADFCGIPHAKNLAVINDLLLKGRFSDDAVVTFTQSLSWRMPTKLVRYASDYCGDQDIKMAVNQLSTPHLNLRDLEQIGPSPLSEKHEFCVTFLLLWQLLNVHYNAETVFVKEYNDGRSTENGRAVTMLFLKFKLNGRRNNPHCRYLIKKSMGGCGFDLRHPIDRSIRNGAVIVKNNRKRKHRTMKPIPSSDVVAMVKRSMKAETRQGRSWGLIKVNQYIKQSNAKHVAKAVLRRAMSKAKVPKSHIDEILSNAA